MFEIKDTKQRIIIFISVCLLILIFYFQLLLKPRIGSLILVSSDVSHTFRMLKQAREDIANMPKVKKSIEELKKKISFYEGNMPTQKEISNLLGELSKFAQATEVKILGILPLEEMKEAERIEEINTPREKEPYIEVPIRIEARATYHNLGSFINKLESGRRFMSISDIKIKRNLATPALHGIQLVVNTYVLTEKEQ